MPESEKSLDEILGSSLGDAFDAADSAPDDPQVPASGAQPITGSDAAGQVRDEHGRFVARPEGSDASQAAAPAAPVKGTPDQGSKPGDGAAATMPPSDAPASWSAAEKAHWKTLPPDVQAVIARREAEFSVGIEQKTQGYQALETVIAPRRDFLNAEYGSVENAVKTLFNLSDFAARDKPGFVKWFCQAHSLNPQEIFGGAPAGDAPQPGQDGAAPAALPPELAAVRAEVEDLKSSLIEAIQAPIMAKAKTELEKFEAETATKYPHYANPAVKQSMGALLARATDDMTYEQAYDRVVWSMPDIRKQLIEAERNTAIEAKAKEAADAAKGARRAAGPQLRSVGTPSEVRAAPASIDQTLGDVWDRMNGTA